MRRTMSSWATVLVVVFCLPWLGACRVETPLAAQSPGPEPSAEDDSATPAVDTTVFTVTVPGEKGQACQLSGAGPGLPEIPVGDAVEWKGVANEPVVVRVKKIAGTGTLLPDDPQGFSKASAVGKGEGVYCYMIRVQNFAGRTLCIMDPEICVRGSSGCPTVMLSEGEKCPYMSRDDFQDSYLVSP